MTVEPTDGVPPIVRTRDLTVELQGRPVLRGIDLDVPRGRVVGLTGHNGAGKSTLLRAVLGQALPAAGCVRVLDGDPARDAHVRRRIAYAAQHPYPTATPVPVRTAVAFGRFARRGPGTRLREEDWRAVDVALERLDLWDLRTAPVTELSGGQRQRVNLARAFATQGDLLLLDEPTSHLDLASTRRVLETIATSPATVVLVTHGAGLEVCDEVHRLAAGRWAA